MNISKGMAWVLVIFFLVLSGTSSAQREDSQEDIREEQIRERNEERRNSLLEHFQIIRWIRQKKEQVLTETSQDEANRIIQEDENEMP